MAANQINNLKDALILSNSKLIADAINLNNAGVMEGGRLFLTIASQLCNDSTARLVAKQCLELKANTVENKGQMESDKTGIINPSRSKISQ